MSQLTPLISDLALILICAGIMTLIFKKLYNTNITNNHKS
jgi:CPA2 family monovalent cation:H+ antiporter-2